MNKGFLKKESSKEEEEIQFEPSDKKPFVGYAFKLEEN